MLQNSDPFFSNDAEGWAKVISVFGGIAVATILALWKMLRGTIDARLTDLEKAQEDYVETKANLESRLSILERDAILLAANLRGMDAAGGRIEKQNEQVLKRLDEQQTALHEFEKSTIERLSAIEGQLRGDGQGHTHRRTGDK